MIIHALQILKHELDANLKSYPPPDGTEKAMLGNISQIDVAAQGGGQGDNELKNKVVLTLVNVREEKALKNLPNHRRNDATLQTEYFNPSVFLNLYLLVSVGNPDYKNALKLLSRAILFFQSKNVFTHENTVAVPESEVSAEDRMDEFKMMVDLYSPSFEEVNHLWGTLGGKQVPFALYLVRIVEMKRTVAPETAGVIEEIQLNTGIRFQ